MSYTVDDLAERVAALTPDEVNELEKRVSGLRAEKVRAEEARIAGLRALSDYEALDAVLVSTGIDIDADGSIDAILVRLRETGFVRGVTLEAAYREGYERGAYDIHVGSGVPNIYAVDDLDYTLRRDLWLETQAKAAAAS
ncbi:hypothetical protein [Methylobacterium sp. SD21]|uniref:hypothetical protein n=1 Tax=Methylobacterium litchii TaxID=3138810 RepID=UPI00313E8974